MLVTMDVVQLYPNIPHELGLKAPEETQEKKVSLSRSPLTNLLSWLNF